MLYYVNALSHTSNWHKEMAYMYWKLYFIKLLKNNLCVRILRNNHLLFLLEIHMKQ